MYNLNPPFKKKYPLSRFLTPAPARIKKLRCCPCVCPSVWDVLRKSNFHGCRFFWPMQGVLKINFNSVRRTRLLLRVDGWFFIVMITMSKMHMISRIIFSTLDENWFIRNILIMSSVYTTSVWTNQSRFINIKKLKFLNKQMRNYIFKTLVTNINYSLMAISFHLEIKPTKKE